MVSPLNRFWDNLTWLKVLISSQELALVLKYMNTLTDEYICTHLLHFFCPSLQVFVFGLSLSNNLQYYSLLCKVLMKANCHCCDFSTWPSEWPWLDFILSLIWFMILIWSHSFELHCAAGSVQWTEAGCYLIVSMLRNQLFISVPQVPARFLKEPGDVLSAVLWTSQAS